MNTVWRYDLPVTDHVTLVEMPRGTQLLHVASQHGQLDSVQLWAGVDPSEPAEPRAFVVRGTGQSVGAEHEHYVGTAIVADGRLVWHLFEVV